VSALTVLTLLVVRGVFSLYPLGALVVLILFMINLLLALRLRSQRFDNSKNRGSVPPSMWFVAAVFTFAGVAAVVAYVKDPNMPHGVQTCVVILLVGYIWYVVYRLHRLSGRSKEKLKRQ
jgi:hypothetical protein